MSPKTLNSPKPEIILLLLKVKVKTAGCPTYLCGDAFLISLKKDITQIFLQSSPAINSRWPVAVK